MAEAKQNNKNMIFRFVTGFAGVYHILLGISALIFPSSLLVKVTNLILGLSPVVDEQFQLIAKFTGAYVLVFGVMLLLLARDPVKYNVLVLPALLLFGIRLVNKIIFFGSISNVYGMPFSRGMFGIASLAVFLLAIGFTAPKGSLNFKS